MIVFVLGGTRSGKSELAERIARDLGGPVTVIATARCDEHDDEFRARIERHRARRDADWVTTETPDDLAGVLLATRGTVVVDSLGTWIAGEAGLRVDPAPLCDALVARGGHTVVVSEEVGLAVHPPTDAGRAFVDALGTCNRAVAAVADRAVLVIAGRVVELGTW